MSDLKDKPAFDEETLARVLEAAYVLMQEHNRTLELSLDLQSDQLREQQAEMLPPVEPAPGAAPQETSSPNHDYTSVLAQIVETQHQIEVRHLPLQSSLTFVTERLTQITKASGSAVGIVEGKTICYQAVSGPAAPPQGSELPLEKALGFTCLHTGHAMRCPDVNPDFLLDAEECHRRGIHGLIAVPVFHDGGIIGALELYFGKVDAFNEQDVHTCQLMTGLITEALARDAELARKKAPTPAAATMPVIEKPKVDLSPPALAPSKSELRPPDVARTPGAAPSTDVCRSCGHRVVAEEQFCGKCGSPRIAESDSHAPTMQSKVASLFKMQQSRDASFQLSDGIASVVEPPAKRNAGDQGFTTSEVRQTDLTEQDRHERAAAKALGTSADEFFLRQEPEQAATSPGEFTAVKEMALPASADESKQIDTQIVPVSVGAESVDSKTPAAETALQKTANDMTWTSASKAREFLEQVARSRNYSAFYRFWLMRRGDAYLALAVILMAVVVRWGIWSEHSVGASGNGSTAHRKQDDLPMFDKMLINLGLADPPDKPAPTGNPDTQVWVDLHTALYYCPGTDLYGKTPKGRFTSQKDAQLDQFEPAYRKVCN